eukprot:TRINITY_DN3997_c0_g1_i1.p1 TRINITY_DN3997_c0_g1~~TRINITY_DN3997_c0_g1_i1.p1  ORF type:complete len:460 (-),score=122.67 TRINITY_DN3997_c0_g1_i1:328-1560(-)
MRQLLTVGEGLRRRYVDEMQLLPSAYEHSLLRVESTDVDRTLMSAQSLLQGLYPEGPQLGGESALASGVQPVPVHTVPADADYKLRASDNCERYLQARVELTGSREWQRKEEEAEDLLALVSSSWYDESVTLATIGRYSDMLVCEHAHGIEDVRGFPSETAPEVTALYDWVVQQRYAPGLLGRLSGGPILAQFKRDIMDFIDDKSANRLKLYSAHDSTITALLSALGILPCGMPEYASRVTLELLLDDSGKYYVRLMFNEEAFELPGCTSPCAVHDYFEATADSTLEEAVAECYVEEEERLSEPVDDVTTTGLSPLEHEPHEVDPNEQPGAEVPQPFPWDTVYWVLALAAGLMGLCGAFCFFFTRIAKSLATRREISMDAAEIELEMEEGDDDSTSAFIIGDEEEGLKRD